MFIVLSATSSIFTDRFLVLNISNKDPSPSGPNRFFEMMSSWSFDSKSNLPNDAEQVSSNPLSEKFKTFSLLVSNKASQINFAPFELRKFEFKLRISSFGVKTNP